MFRTALISMFLTSTALADTWTVDDDGKADFDNIQAAVDAASDGDEILVAPGTYTSTANEVVNILGKAVTLRSLYPNNPDVVATTIIDGEGVRRGIFCNSSETNKTIIEGFTLINGYGVVGGGMFCNSASPTVQDCIFTSNSSENGGGVYCLFSNSNFNDCSFDNNIANVDEQSGGGGMFLSVSSPTITNCSFANNVASNGGGIYCQSSTPTLENCTFENNSSYSIDIKNPGKGGAMFCTLNNISSMANCTFTSNAAQSEGGGVYCLNNSDLLMTNCTFTSNVAPIGGGGIYNKDDGELILGNCTFSANNSGDGFGAGIYCWQSKTTLTDCVFEFNNAKYCAGIYFVGKTLDLYSCTFNNNAALEDSGAIGCGGAPSVGGVILAIDNCDFNSNTAYGKTRGYGGAISFYGGTDSCRCTISNSSFQNNSANLYGGAIELALWSENADGTISNCLFSNNSSGFGGGAIYHDLYSSNEPRNVVTGTIFCSNLPNHIFGPWINGGGNCLGFSCEDTNDDGTPDECSEDADFLLHVPEEYSTIQSAVIAAGHGAEIIVGPGVYTGEYFSVIDTGGKELWIHSTDGPEATIIDGEGIRNGIRFASTETTNTIIEGFKVMNCFSSYYGGGISCSFSNPTIRNCIISANSCGSGGGGALNVYSDPIFENCAFLDNNAIGNVGGGMRNYYSNPTVSNCEFINNSSSSSFGGGMSNNLCNTTISNCTFTNNFAQIGGGGVANYSTTITFNQCTLSNNESESGGGIWNQGEFQQVSSIITACKISYNIAQEGGGIFNSNCTPSIDESVICGNTVDQIFGKYKDKGNNSINDQCPCHSDINGDGNVDVIDLIAIIAAWNCQNCLAEDLNADGIVDMSDLLMVVGNWGECE